MARQRIILPEYWLDAELAQCDYVVRLFYIGTWNFSDDYGVIEDNLPKLRAQIFPFDLSINLLPIRDKLVVLKKFIPFEAECKKWLYIKNFPRYQKVENPSKWQNPQPPLELTLQTLPESSVSPHRRGGIEEKRREEKYKETAKAVISLFCQEYETIKGVKYQPSWQKDYSMVYHFLSGKNIPKYEDLIEWYLNTQKSNTHPSLSACLSADSINKYNLKHKDD